jgi:alpha-glucosidase
VTITCAHGSYTLIVLASDLIRVRFQPANRLSAPLFSYSIAKSDDEWLPCDFHITEAEAAVEIRTSRLVCRVTRASGKLAFLDLEGNVVNGDEAGAGWHSSSHVICQKRIQPDEHFYGPGERTFGLDLRERK